MRDQGGNWGHSPTGMLMGFGVAIFLFLAGMALVFWAAS